MVRKTTTRVRKGIVLIAVLVVVALLSLAAYQYSDLTMAEYRASELARRQTQARALAESGVHYTAAMLSNPDNISGMLGGNYYSNPTAFAHVTVPGDAAKGFPGTFTLLAPADGDDGSSVRHGVIDEAGKINLNALIKLDAKGQLVHDVLMKLPDMNEEIASAIADWLDADNQPRTGGAENDYYSGLNPPYRAKNGPLESLEELLLVKGVTPQLLFGSDRNRNNILDKGEESDGGLVDRGWSAYLTIHSREQLLDAAGEALLNLNGDDLAMLHEVLGTEVGEDVATYIVYYRQYGPSSSKSSGKTSSKSGKGGKGGKRPSGNSAPEFDLTRKAKKKISSLFDLVDSQVSVPAKDPKEDPVIIPSPLRDPAVARNVLPLLFEMSTVSSRSEIPARINVNTAPREVLLAIPGLSETDVDSMVSVRPRLSSSEPPGEIFQTPTWLLTEAGVKPATLQKLEKYLTTRAQVFRVQVVGTLDTPGPSARIEAVIDTNGGSPRILALRDLTELGVGWTPEK